MITMFIVALAIAAILIGYLVYDIVDTIRFNRYVKDVVEHPENHTQREIDYIHHEILTK